MKEDDKTYTARVGEKLQEYATKVRHAADNFTSLGEFHERADVFDDRYLSEEGVNFAALHNAVLEGMKGSNFSRYQGAVNRGKKYVSGERDDIDKQDLTTLLEIGYRLEDRERSDQNLRNTRSDGGSATSQVERIERFVERHADSDDEYQSMQVAALKQDEASVKNELDTKVTSHYGKDDLERSDETDND